MDSACNRVAMVRKRIRIALFLLLFRKAKKKRTMKICKKRLGKLISFILINAEHGLKALLLNDITTCLKKVQKTKLCEGLKLDTKSPVE